MKILHLTLKKKWFDMVGVTKPEEYREVKPYWIVRLISKRGLESEGYNPKDLVSITLDFISDFPLQINQIAKEFDVIEFKNGYGKKAPTKIIEFKGLDLRTGNPAWGAEPGKEYFVIKLGNILNHRI